MKRPLYINKFPQWDKIRVINKAINVLEDSEVMMRDVKDGKGLKSDIAG